MMNTNTKKIIAGGTNDFGLGAKTLADSINVMVNIVPLATEGKPLSVAELNKLRIGSQGQAQHPNVSYGVTETKAPKTSKGKAKTKETA